MRFEHDYDSLRIGSVVTAYEDCSGITSLTYFSRILGISIEEAVNYFFTTSLAKDLERVTKEGQEIPDSNSYFVHFRALGICSKSAYSAQAVGYMYNLIHFTGSFMGDQRSLNATIIPTCTPNEMSVLGGFIGMAFHGSGSFRRAVASKKGDIEAEEDL